MLLLPEHTIKGYVYIEDPEDSLDYQQIFQHKTEEDGRVLFPYYLKASFNVNGVAWEKVLHLIPIKK